MDGFIFKEELPKLLVKAFGEDVSKEINEAFNNACFNNLKKYYPQETASQTALYLLNLSCEAIRAGELIFDERFISSYAKELKSGDTNIIFEILDLKVIEAKFRCCHNNEYLISVLPSYIKDNREVLLNFINDGVCDGLINRCKRIAKFMNVPA